MPSERFTGFGPAVSDWFEALGYDNSRAYWAATKDVWQRDVRDPLEELLVELAGASGAVPKVFRPHRDLRFARDAAPLKTATGGYLPGADGSPAARYLEVSAGGLYVGTGYHRLATDQLQRYRDAAAGKLGRDLQGALDAVAAANLELGGEVLRGVPRGVARDHPHVALLRRKALVAGARMVPGPELETRAPLAFVRATWAAAAPVVAWLDAHVGASRLDPDEARGRPRR